MVHGQNVEITDAVRARIAERLESSLGPYARKVEAVNVRLHSPPLGGGPTSSFVRVDLFHPLLGVAAGESDSDPEAAIAKAVARAVDAVGREIAHARRAPPRRAVGYGDND